jgi:exosortase family protein XrtF
MTNLFKEPIVKFLAVGFLLYVGWMAAYEWIIHPWGVADKTVVDSTIFITQNILNVLGYVTESDGNRLVYIVGSPGVLIGDSCDGISLMALFSIFIISFPGNIKVKFFFVLAGVAVIHVLNILRVVLLAIIITYSYEWTEFNHTYTFTILIYACIFFMWIVWINQFSGLKAIKDEKK